MIIGRTAAAALVAGLMPAACADPGSAPPPSARPSSAHASVPPGCAFAGARVQWSAYTKRPLLTQVTLFRLTDDPASRTGTELLDEPVAPSISEVDAPAAWVPGLARSLSKETGDKVHAGPARLKDGGYGTVSRTPDDATIPESVLYVGVQAVSAGFVVDCAVPVRGTFHSWTSMDYGTVHCGSFEPPSDPLGRLARAYCPRTPSARPRSVPSLRLPTAAG
ncbi:hypothetical protein AB0J80_38140 [Actinoplanes sp. NPDC049548]|uniref:hypothetical protein n=1 Tax=Actinoplanes sp. NPDC049548 TaxID=3155152 RepID=UPI00342CADE1